MCPITEKDWKGLEQNVFCPQNKYYRESLLGGGLKRVTQYANSPHNTTKYPLQVGGFKRVAQNACSPHNATVPPSWWGDIKCLPKMPVLYIMPQSAPSWWGIEKSFPKCHRVPPLGGGLKMLTQNACSPYNATKYPLLVGGLKMLTQNACAPSWWGD